jgi:hypothetical protein
MAEAVSSLPSPMKHFILFCAQFHLLPESYLFGLADVQSVGNSWPTFLFGKIHAHGLWYYFPVVLSAKWTLATLGLLAVTIYGFARARIGCRREVLFLAVPALLYFGIAMASPLNMGVRHILPIFPFVFVLIGAGCAGLLKRQKAWTWAIGALLLLHAADSLHAFPNYLPYENALWGGSSNTYRHFSDAAVDWGQQLKWTKQWTDQHQVKECWFAYFVTPFILPADYGIPCKLLPTFDSSYEQEIEVPRVVHGPILVSFGDLYGYEFGTWVRNPYQALARRKPDAVIADAIAVYYGDYELPQASALEYVTRSRGLLHKDPQKALAAAQTAVSLVPDGFDENLALGGALAATGDPNRARAALLTAQRRIPEMEPTAQEVWRPTLEKRIAKLAGR